VRPSALLSGEAAVRPSIKTLFFLTELQQVGARQRRDPDERG
jgi:hypothetical protein